MEMPSRRENGHQRARVHAMAVTADECKVRGGHGRCLRVTGGWLAGWLRRESGGRRPGVAPWDGLHRGISFVGERWAIIAVNPTHGRLV